MKCWIKKIPRLLSLKAGFTVSLISELALQTVSNVFNRKSNQMKKIVFCSFHTWVSNRKYFLSRLQMPLKMKKLLARP